HKKLGAGDQGIMFGYACNETKSFMPLPIALAHKLAEKIDLVRESKKLTYLKPDGKTQVTVQYEKGKPKKAEQIVIAVPHEEKVSFDELKQDLLKKVITPVL